MIQASYAPNIYKQLCNRYIFLLACVQCTLLSFSSSRRRIFLKDCLFFTISIPNKKLHYFRSYKRKRICILSAIYLPPLTPTTFLRHLSIFLSRVTLQKNVIFLSVKTVTLIYTFETGTVTWKILFPFICWPGHDQSSSLPAVH